MTARALRLGSREFPVVLPTLRDPRLHLASVIISIHVLGQVALGFDVSVAQILIAILTCAVIEFVWTLRTTGKLVWPASALLTGSGVALIFRVLGTEHGDWWSLRGWHLFAIVAAGSLISKYVIRWRGSHVFNPSNLGLVVAFILLGSSRVEPLDFWWAPFGPGMALAYGIIIAGGLLITRRLRLLEMGAAFWVTLAAATGVLAASGHCFTARWAFEPVCGTHFWWVIVTSPEVLVFLFFMITDPKTVPAGRVAKAAFGAAIALLATLLIAPFPTEFGAKVALLGALVAMTAVRPVFERFFPERGAAEDDLRTWLRSLLPEPRRGLAAGLMGGATAVLLVGAAIVVAGAPAREPAGALDAPVAQVDVEVDPASLPAVTVDPEVAELSADFAGPGAQALAVALAENLQAEAQALLAGDKALLAAADAHSRLKQMETKIDEAAASGQTVVSSYDFDTLHLVRAFPYGEQGGARPGREARGTQTDITYDAAGNEVSRTTEPCAYVFALGEAEEGRWLILSAVPLEV